MRALLASLLLLAAARADVVVNTLDGKRPLRGISLSANAGTVSLQSAEGPLVKVSTADVVEIVSVPQPTAPQPSSRPFELLLTDGTRVRGVLEKGPEGSVRLVSPVLRETVGHLDIALEQVVGVRRVDGRKIPGASRLVPVRDFDVAYTLTGAQIKGFLKEFRATGVVLDREGLSSQRVSYDDLAAIFVDNQAMPREEGLHVVARLADGSAFVLNRTFSVAGGELTGRTPSGIAIRVRLTRMAALGFMGASFVHVSDLEPARIDREPFFPVPEGPERQAMLEFVCPVRVDESPDGRPITVGQRRYFKGIGVRPRTALTYRLDGKFRIFQSVCGIDDEIFGPGYGRGGGAGSVVFSVFADGKKIYESPVVSGGKEPQHVRVKVEGVKELKLVVDRVPKDKMPKGRADSPELDNAVWARPLLIR